VARLHGGGRTRRRLLRPALTADERTRIDRVGAAPDDAGRDFLDEQIWLSDHARRVVTALSRIADLVLSGRASVELAYLVVGQELTRRSRPLRGMLFLQHHRWMAVDTLASQGGTRERIMSLVDLMWAEGVRRQDLATHTVRAAAEAKRSGTGALCRRRVRALSRSTGGPRRVARRLTASLRIAEKDPPEEWPRWLKPREGMAASTYECDDI
jgi:hypothetical protein